MLTLDPFELVTVLVVVWDEGNAEDEFKNASLFADMIGEDDNGDDWSIGDVLVNIVDNRNQSIIYLLFNLSLLLTMNWYNSFSFCSGTLEWLYVDDDMCVYALNNK